MSYLYFLSIIASKNDKWSTLWILSVDIVLMDRQRKRSILTHTTDSKHILIHVSNLV